MALRAKITLTAIKQSFMIQEQQEQEQIKGTPQTKLEPEYIGELSGVTSNVQFTEESTGETLPLSTSEVFEYSGENFFNLTFLESTVENSHVYKGVSRVRVEGDIQPSIFDKDIRLSGENTQGEGVVIYHLAKDSVRLYNNSGLSKLEKFCLLGLYRVLSFESLKYNNYKEGMFKGLPEEKLPKECEDWKGSKGVYIKFTPSQFAELLGITGGDNYRKLLGVEEPEPMKKVIERRIIKTPDGKEIIEETLKEVKKSEVELDAEKKGLIITLGQKMITYPTKLASDKRGNYLYVRKLSKQLYNVIKVTESVTGKDGKKRESVVYYLNLSLPFVYEANKHYITGDNNREWRYLQENWSSDFGTDLFIRLRAFFNFVGNKPYERLFPEFLRDIKLYDVEKLKNHPKRVYSELENILLRLKDSGVISKFEIVFSDGSLITDTLKVSRGRGSKKNSMEKIRIYPPLLLKTKENNN